MATVNINLGLTAAAAGTVDAITATYSPVPTLFNRLTLYFEAAGANTSTTPTFNPNSLGAKTIVKKNNQALVAGDIAGQYFVAHVQYNSTLDKWVLLNPASDATDSIWEESAGIVKLIDETKPVRIGETFGLGRFGITSEVGQMSFEIADIVGGILFTIQQQADGFHFALSSGSFIFDATVEAATQSAGDNSTKVATTEYSDRVNVQSVASAATVTATAANDLVIITAQAEALTLANPTGSWQQGQALAIRIKDNGTSRSIGYGAKFRALGTTLPTATTISKTLYLFVIYNSTDDTFDVTGVSEQA